MLIVMNAGIDKGVGETRSFVLIRARYARNGGSFLEEKRKGGNVVNTVWEIAAPLAERLGLILWDVRFVKEGANWYLRIIIDKPGGVCIDDCVAMNDALDTPLDEADPIQQSYNLQVASAGLERELTRDFHFRMFLGEKIQLRLRAAYNGAKKHKCVLTGYEDGGVAVAFPDGETHTFTKNEVAGVRLDDFPEEF